MKSNIFYKLLNRNLINQKFRIVLDDIPVEIIYKEIKNIHLIVYPPYGNVKISAPKGIPLETIKYFAASKSGWINKHRAKYKDAELHLNELHDKRECYYHLGKRYDLKIIFHTGKPKIILSENTIELYTRKGSSLRKKQSLLNEWSREQLKNLIPQFIQKWETRINVSVSGFGIKKMKTRWGSCNTKTKRIWLNLELAKKPIYCLEYIVVHEIVHLLEKKHNYRFKKYMDEFLPGWREYKHELNHFPVSEDLPDK
ncbi:MAG: M48 family peptidase [Ignavibacteriales bacterium]|nr:MAG: M48 family peptidase [Ignavibacteriales bacterium]